MTTTMAVGDGANDVAMIRQAHIGVGIAGREGLHACVNSDMSLTEFKHLKHAILCHGRWLHIRTQECYEYVIERNTPLALLHIVYSFFNRHTMTTFIDSLLLVMFNVLITLLPILF